VLRSREGESDWCGAVTPRSGCRHLMSDGSTDASLDDGTYEDVAGGELSSPEGASSPMGTLTPAASQRP
jgi:hypothetical protein